jgi:uncharacterized protein (TIGR02569 family)
VLATSARTGTGLEEQRTFLVDLAAAGASPAGGGRVTRPSSPSAPWRPPPMPTVDELLPSLLEASDGHRAAADAAVAYRRDARAAVRSFPAEVVRALFGIVTRWVQDVTGRTPGAPPERRAEVTVRVEAVLARELELSTTAGRSHEALARTIGATAVDATPGGCPAVAVAGKICVMPTSPCNPTCGEVPPAVLNAFGIDSNVESPTMGGVHLYPDVVLKPVTHAAEAQWCADVLETLELEQVRLPRPLRTASGAAVVMGWCGWERLAGQAAPEQWADVLAVAGRLHRGLADRSRPGWMDTKNDLWRRADRYAWDEAALTTPHDRHVHRLHPLLEQLETLRISKRPPSPAQVVHIDLLGNVLFAEQLAPAVIDPTFYWRPAGYAEAVVAVDAAAWTTAGTAPLAHLAARGGLHLLIRAARFRVARDVLSPDASADQVAAHTKVAAWLLEYDDH